MSDHLHLAVALDGAGWHPAAWRAPDARPEELFTARYWADLVGSADRARLDLVTVEDGLRLQSDDPYVPDARTDRVRGRLDAVLIAARVAPLTTHVGLVPTVTVTHTEPFHVSKAIATLDYVSGGRAGVRVQAAHRADEAAHFGRRRLDGVPAADRLAEVGDYVEVLRRLWDSWEDDAEIRDVATGRFVDRDKLHYIDFDGRWFAVKGPSITPRPPQGQPLVTALAHTAEVREMAAAFADVVFVTPADAVHAHAAALEVAAAARAAARAEAVHVFGELFVVLDDTAAAARARHEQLDHSAGAPYVGDAPAFVGTATQLADRLLEWQAAGLSGFRLRPAALPHDLEQITGRLVPELQRRGAFRTEADGTSLRARLGLARPANRYAVAGKDAS